MSGIVGLRVRRPHARWTLAIIAGVATVCMVAAGCASNPSNRSPRNDESKSSGEAVVSIAPGKAAATSPVQKLTIGYSGPFTSLDTTGGAGGSGYFIMGQLSLETLLRVTPDGKLQPWLATSWTQNSPTEYVYTLRQGVKFWDGNELTADDVVFSLTRNAGVALGKAGFYGSVSKIQARDPHTVVVTLKHPDAAWKNTPGLAYAQIYQKAFTEAHQDTFGKPGTLVMGTGPWKVNSLDPTKGAEYAANPTYWGGEPPIKHITVKFYQSETSLALAMRAGEVDLAPVVGEPDSFKSASGVQVVTRTTCGSSLFSMPTQTAPWSDVHVRRAVAYALDKQELLKVTGGANIDTLDTVIAPSLLQNLGDAGAADAALKTLPTYPHDMDKAKQEIAQSSRPNGFSATIASGNDQATLKINQAIAAQLKTIGINLEIKPMTQTAYYAVLLGPADKRPPLFISTGGCAPDPSWGNNFIGDRRLNLANYHPAEVDTLIADGLATTDPAKRLQIYIQILDKLATDLPYIPLFREGTSYASNNFEWVNFGDFWAHTCWPLNIKPR
ncbi:ABC transporter substrate-binding protein [Sphaerisporangium sp. NPDC051017]|uniref:ABC transporter substrate-binding protein n=1 Tax=Sphaerisporangium sp. NPDC051017 TaxID=3154636 RepID=UPI00341F63EB